MENFAPERTLTSNGFSPAPSFWPCNVSRLARDSSICRSTSFDTCPCRLVSRQASVWIVKPGGTGSPALVISARPAPLPPRSSFILPLPSALPPPKEKTYLVAEFFSVVPKVSGRVCVAIMSVLPLLFRRFFGFFAFGHDFGEIGDGGKFFQQ